MSRRAESAFLGGSWVYHAMSMIMRRMMNEDDGWMKLGVYGDIMRALNERI